MNFQEKIMDLLKGMGQKKFHQAYFCVNTFQIKNHSSNHCFHYERFDFNIMETNRMSQFHLSFELWAQNFIRWGFSLNSTASEILVKIRVIFFFQLHPNLHIFYFVIQLQSDLVQNPLYQYSTVITYTYIYTYKPIIKRTLGVFPLYSSDSAVLVEKIH